jgi:hypothetical protein
VSGVDRLVAVVEISVGNEVQEFVEPAPQTMRGVEPKARPMAYRSAVESRRVVLEALADAVIGGIPPLGLGPSGVRSTAA